MEPLVGLVAFAIAASIASLVASERRRAHLRVWGAAAKRVALAGVERAEGGFFGGEFLQGSSGDLRVRLEGYRQGKSVYGTKIVISGLGHGVGGLSLRREGLGTAIEKRVIGEREIEIGDPSFDEEWYVQGQAPLALALLDGETRRRVAALLRKRFVTPSGEWVDVDPSLSDGLLEVRVKESGFSGNRERIPQILEGVLEVARRLVKPPDVAARLGENLRGEPEPGARLRLLLTLSREFPFHAATREALLAAREDASEEVRLRAGIALGEEGRETLLELVAGTGTSDSCAARAIAALGEGLPAEQAEATLRHALRGAGRPQTARACLEALARLGRVEAEGLILGALRSEDAPVAVAAAKALGRVGTVESVAALREAMLPRGDLLRSAGRQAIAEIQARLKGAEPGQLSLAGGEAGALSLADGEPGRLSLAEEAPPPVASSAAEPEARPGPEPEPEEATPSPKPQRGRVPS